MSIWTYLERLVSERYIAYPAHSTRHPAKVKITVTLPMTPIITVFERSPDRGKGLARDMRVRWALEEVGQPYKFVLFHSLR
jgi:glutathione S-transferase